LPKSTKKTDLIITSPIKAQYEKMLTLQTLEYVKNHIQTNPSLSEDEKIALERELF